MASGPEASSTSKLYTPRLLALSASLADYPMTGPFDVTADGRSKTCGSTISIGLDCDKVGGISRVGMQVSACAVGQSSAAIMAQAARGRSAKSFEAMVTAIESWLAESGALPDWPGFDALEPALPHKGRHGAILLPWKAAIDALSSRRSSG